MKKTVWTARRRIALARARRAPAAETRRIRIQLARRDGGEASGLAGPAAATGPRAVLHAIGSAPVPTATVLPWPEEAPDQHLVATGTGQ